MITDLLPSELEPETEPRQLLHYTDSEGFEDWWELGCPMDMASFQDAVNENSEKGISWKIEVIEADTAS